MSEDFLWVEKYRPTNIDDIILPVELKKRFKAFLSQENVPNLLFIGSAGVGKTTVAKSLVKMLKSDYIVINGSLDRNIDTLRNEIMQFASSISFTGGRKYVIIDEADHLNPTSTQPALRNFMEEFSGNCGFILTANYPSKIIPALHSRCSVVDFKTGSEGPQLAFDFMKRLEQILKIEKIEYDQAAVATVIQKWFPDWRRVLNELQHYSATGKIDSGILVNLEKVSIDELIAFMKKKEYSNVRKWVAENSDGGQAEVFRTFYDNASELFDKRFIPLLVVKLAEYQYKAAFSVDPEINLAAFFAEIMVEAQWA